MSKRLLSVLGESRSPVTAFDNIVSYWKLDEFSDKSGAVTRADSVGTNTLIETTAVKSITGKISLSPLFTTVGGSVLYSNDTASLSTGDIDYTIAGWLYLTSLPATDASFISKYLTAGDQREYRFNVNAAGLLEFRVSGNGTASTAVNSAVTIAAETWYYVIGWHDSVNNKIYIQVNNEIPVSADHAGGSFDSTAKFVLNQQDSAGTFIDGKVDEVGFWKRVLTSKERSDLYNNGNGLTYG